MRSAASVLTCIAALGFSTLAHSAPFTPRDGDEVLERLRDRPLDTAARELRRLRAELSRNPQNLSLATQLARRYIDEARAQADPRYLGYAEAALGPWWASPQPPNSVLLLRATIRQSNHDFDSALTDLSRVIKLEPANTAAWLTRANLLQIKGDYEGAAQSCERLARFAGEFIAGTCRASIGSMTGRAEASYSELTRLLEAAPSASAAQKAWIETALAEIAVRLDRRFAAEGHFKRALQYGQPDAYLKAAYADFLLDTGRPAEVARLLAADTRIDALLLRLALADQALGKPELDGRIATLQARFDAARARGDRVHQREEARFHTQLLNRPQEGLRLAQANWAVQREPADARVLLESALAAGAPDGAAPVIEWIRENHIEDATLQRLAQRTRKNT
jgi:hypothetical protein